MYKLSKQELLVLLGYHKVSTQALLLLHFPQPQLLIQLNIKVQRLIPQLLLVAGAQRAENLSEKRKAKNQTNAQDLSRLQVIQINIF